MDASESVTVNRKSLLVSPPLPETVFDTIRFPVFGSGTGSPLLFTFRKATTEPLSVIMPFSPTDEVV